MGFVLALGIELKVQPWLHAKMSLFSHDAKILLVLVNLVTFFNAKVNERICFSWNHFPVKLTMWNVWCLKASHRGPHTSCTDLTPSGRLLWPDWAAKYSEKTSTRLVLFQHYLFNKKDRSVNCINNCGDFLIRMSDSEAQHAFCFSRSI